jgi:hypothetical protein
MISLRKTFMSGLLEKQLEREYYYSTQQVYKRCISDWIESHDFDYFVTLTFANSEISKENAERALNTHFIWVNKASFTNSERKKGKRVLMMPFIEKNALDGYHFHIFLKVPSGTHYCKIKQVVRDCWCRLKESGKAPFDARDENNNHKWFMPIYNPRGLTKYVLKQSSNLLMDNLVADLISKSKS